jgi:Zn-dependent protease
MQVQESLFFVAILIISIIIHEVAHGFAALYYGDQTAKHAGRLTLNPIPHIDLFGSIILPLLLAFSGTGLIIGWAKPVPYNPGNFRNKKVGTLVVASAGILANILLAIIFGGLVRILSIYAPHAVTMIELSSMIVLVNVVLAIFNLVPVPPLDGSKILFSFFGYKAWRFYAKLERYSFVFVVLFVIFLWQYLTPLIFHAFSLFTGLAI